MDEFGLIEKYLYPLAKNHDGAFDLKDDAAVFSCSEGFELVITKDAITENVHFLPNTTAENIAKKLLRTNLSDMAAMGAIPKYYLISSIGSEDVDENWIKSFTETLKLEQEAFNISLIGGDTVKHKGPLSLSMTMIGEVETGKALRRNGAKNGDGIYVTGTIGDSALGLREIKENGDKEALISRYLVPQPRVNVGRELVEVANAAIDVSDGLLADLEHICAYSNCGAEINQDAVPLSADVAQAVENNKELMELALCGGDDYELLFTASPEQNSIIEQISDKAGIRITKIGQINDKKELSVVDVDGNEIKYNKLGFSHV